MENNVKLNFSIARHSQLGYHLNLTGNDRMKHLVGLLVITVEVEIAVYLPDGRLLQSCELEK